MRSLPERTPDRRGFLALTGAVLLGGAGAAAITGPAAASTGGLFDPSKHTLNVRVAAVNGTDVTLAWDNPPPEDIEGWRFFAHDNGRAEFTFSNHLQIPTSVTLKRMQSGINHDFTVRFRRAGDHQGDNFSPFSTPVRVSLPASSDTTPPTAPPNAHQVFDPELYELTSFWDPSTDNVTPQADIQYDLVNYSDGITFHYDAVSPVTAWLSGTMVRAVDAAGNRSPAVLLS